MVQRSAEKIGDGEKLTKGAWDKYLLSLQEGAVCKNLL